MDLGFNLVETEGVTKEDVSIVYTPSDDVTNYQYLIIKDDLSNNYIKVNSRESIHVTLSETGKYKIKIKEYDKFGRETIVESGYYLIDKEAPVINVGSNIEVRTNEDHNFLNDVSAYDNYDGDISSKIVLNDNDISLDVPGIKQITYQVEDSAGNVTSINVDVSIIKSNSSSLLIIQTIFFSLLALIVLIIYRYRKSVILERRIGKHSIKPLKDNSVSLSEKLSHKYNKLLKKLSISLEKSVFLTNYSKRYTKYTSLYNDSNYNSMDFISSKIIVSLLFLLIAIFSKTIEYQVINLYELIIPLIAGFFAPDILYAIKYKIYRNKIENDLLQAIIIMNNAFKSGRSITQAILLVSEELDGVIASDFSKMHKELSSGLSVEDVFRRFSKRIDLEEATYLTASLSILNRTGGNIIKVFSSIEKSLFNKKKLKLELKSLTSSSKLIVYVLFLVPILFVLFISLIDSDYFKPLFTSSIGLFIVGIIAVMYIIYIIVVNKVLKVRM